MLLMIQLPIADMRSFLFEAEKLARPDWKTADYWGSDFVRCFGGLYLRRNGDQALLHHKPWEELRMCESNRALRFTKNIDLSDHRAGLYVPFRTAFRRFYSDMRVLSKFEVGIGTAGNLIPGEKPLRFTKNQIESMVSHLLQLHVHIPNPSDPRWREKEYPLILAGKPLARLYSIASTSTASSSAIQDWWVTTGDPHLFLVTGNEEQVEPPFNLKPIPFGIQLFYGLAYYRGRPIPMWIIQQGNRIDDRNVVAIRNLRLYLLQLHAVSECIRLLTRYINTRHLNFVPGTRLELTLEDYLAELLTWIEQPGAELFNAAVVEKIHQLQRMINPGQAILPPVNVKGAAYIYRPVSKVP